MRGSEGALVAFDAHDNAIKDLDSFEQAIVEICPFEMQVEICALKKKIKGTKG